MRSIRNKLYKEAMSTPFDILTDKDSGIGNTLATVVSNTSPMVLQALRVKNPKFNKYYTNFEKAKEYLSGNSDSNSNVNKLRPL